MTLVLTAALRPGQSFRVTSLPRRARAVAVSLLFSLTALLPPSGWALCVGADGHFELEPAGRGEPSCCEDAAPGGPAEAIAPDDCGACLDLALAPGLALRTKPDGGMIEPVVAAPAAVSGFSDPSPAHAADPTAHSPARPGGAGTRPTVLRC